MAAPKSKDKGGAKGPKTLAAPTKAAPKQKAKPAKKKK